MKIVVTYEAADITRLIRQDMAKQGITTTDGDVKYVKGKAVVSVEVSSDDVPAPSPVPAPAEEHVRPEVPKTAPPKLEALSGGNEPFDMDAIHRASAKVAATNPGKFPVPERQLMEGESFDFPGDKR
jgi:hypothetical protein